MKLSILMLIASAAVALPMAHMDHDHETSNSNQNKTMAMDHNHMNDTMEPSPAKMGAHHHHGRPILEDPNLEPQQRAFWEAYNTTTYLSAPAPAKSFLYGHIFLNVLSWVFVFPVALMLSVEHSPFYLPVQTLHSALVICSLLFLGIYSATGPDLYPNNAYSKVSLAMFFVVLAHWAAAVIKTIASWALNSSKLRPIDGADYVLANLDSTQQYRLSQDSGHGLTSPTGSSSRFNSDDELRDDIVRASSDEEKDVENQNEDGEEDMFMFGRDSYSGAEEPLTSSSAQSIESRVQSRLISRLMQNKKLSTVVEKFGSLAGMVFTLTNRPLFMFGYFYLMLGIVTVYRMGMANAVFNILAHFIKGSVFFLFGIFTFGRYLGAFADVGMAWNANPSSAGSTSDNGITISNSKKKNRYEYGYAGPSPEDGVSKNLLSKLLAKINVPSMEFVECGLVFIYGITNVFMEHLGNEDGQWSHKDLQHASIAFMYIGGGLCGLLIECQAVRNLFHRAFSGEIAQDEASTPYRINPFPAFIVFWTGVLMSKHQQALPLSTEIHMQWGYLLSIGAMLRLGTYVLLYLSKDEVQKSVVPTRPFTELLVSFCLICGGMVFIESNSQTVEAMIYRGLDGMFTLNVNVGVAALIMAWEMIVMAIKGLAHRRR